MNGLSNTATRNAVSIFRLYSPASTTYVKHFHAEGSAFGYATSENQNFVGGYFNTTSAINALQFTVSSGTFSGTTSNTFTPARTFTLGLNVNL